MVLDAVVLDGKFSAVGVSPRVPFSEGITLEHGRNIVRGHSAPSQAGRVIYYRHQTTSTDRAFRLLGRTWGWAQCVPISFPPFPFPFPCLACWWVLHPSPPRPCRCGSHWFCTIRSTIGLGLALLWPQNRPISGRQRLGRCPCTDTFRFWRGCGIQRWRSAIASPLLRFVGACHAGGCEGGGATCHCTHCHFLSPLLDTSPRVVLEWYWKYSFSEQPLGEAEGLGFIRGAYWGGKSMQAGSAHWGSGIGLRFLLVTARIKVVSICGMTVQPTSP